MFVPLHAYADQNEGLFISDFVVGIIINHKKLIL